MLKKIAHWYLKLVEAVCVFMLIVILGCMCIQIGCRLLSVGQSFTEELAKLCFSVMIFIGAPLAMAEGADICVDMLLRRQVPHRTRYADLKRRSDRVGGDRLVQPPTSHTTVRTDPYTAVQ